MKDAVHRPSMADVAARAGVSHQTVSRVLNDPGSVAPATRKRVESAIAELHYRRNLAARALAGRHARVIGVLSDMGPWFGPTQSLVAIERGARAMGYLTVAGVLTDAADLGTTVRQFLDLGVEGAIVIAHDRPTLGAARMLSGQLPVCLVCADGQHADTAQVVIDQYGAARAATRHLLDSGRRHIAHLAGPIDWFDAARREQGWRDELSDAGLDHIVRAAGWRAVEGYRATQSLLASGTRFDAVFAANDMVALGAIRAANAVGLRVPEDIAIAGFDDVEGADQFLPPLTSVRQPFPELGLAAVGQLGRLLAGQATEPVVLRPELVIRTSSASPR
ncbi:DNA-binding transcriptional regulator, LacI/PurR family [Propionibacterium cyclohexanicum]|uniref:DNA-binding transcriptional regulator, LacI/PurR family n=1 Tax=Propionibacterium cyclohexanicum TaxID=64702 RepID=A0A1H9QBM7_9ACTN|nr:LacI family DNA-binding transcriptional regulator [Propionibacterium cyclohexanicum]SER57946.1 DNA-binding transcriptional regulator, LacI/PurR family [Propionibacterium cyclohexanicum]